MAGKAATKSEILANIANATELSRKQVSGVFASLSTLVAKNVGKKGPGIFVVPGLMKVIVVQKAADIAARMGINPFTKQEQMFKAKPARQRDQGPRPRNGPSKTWPSKSLRHGRPARVPEFTLQRVSSSKVIKPTAASSPDAARSF